MKLDELTKHPAIVLVSLLDVVVSLGMAFIDALKNYKILKTFKFNFDMDYFEITIRILATLFLFLLWRSFIKTKKDVERHLNNINEHWYNELTSLSSALTKNLNEVNRINSNKISFITFHFNNQHLSKQDYFSLLAERGFSKEDLEEIGIDEDVISQNNDLIFPKSVVDKYLDFKQEMEKHKKSLLE